eukprot:240728_1
MADDGMTLKVQLWDIAGQDRFIGLAPTYYRHAVAAITAVDITNKTSLQNSIKWKTDVDDKIFLSNGDNIPVVLFVNKCDLVEDNFKMRQISDTELDEFCYENNFIGWFSVSAKSGMNIKKGVNFLLSKIIDNIQILGIGAELKKNKPNVVKILVIGDHNTGKTSIVRRYVYKQFDEYSVEATIGMDIASKHVRIGVPSNNKIGFSVNGAKDVNTFRQCIEQNIMPNAASITYSGLLYEYQFATETVGDLNKNYNHIDGSMLFYPSYCYAKVKKLDFDMHNEYKTDINNDDEYYMTVGLNSNIIESAFKRKR